MPENAYTLFTDVHLRHLEDCFARAFSQLSACTDFSTEEAERLIHNVQKLDALCVWVHEDSLRNGDAAATAVVPPQAETEEAVAEPAKGEQAPWVEPKMVPPTNVETYTKEEVKAIIIPLAAKFTDPGQMPKILKDVAGADRLSDVPEEKYPELIAAVRKAAEG